MLLLEKLRWYCEHSTRECYGTSDGALEPGRPASESLILPFPVTSSFHDGGDDDRSIYIVTHAIDNYCTIASWIFRYGLYQKRWLSSFFDLGQNVYEVFAFMYSFLYLYLYLYVYLYLCPFLFLGRCVQGASPRVWEVSRASASGQPRWKARVQNGSLAIGRWFKDNPLGKTTLDNMCIVVSF